MSPVLRRSIWPNFVGARIDRHFGEPHTDTDTHKLTYLLGYESHCFMVMLFIRDLKRFVITGILANLSAATHTHTHTHLCLDHGSGGR